MTNYVPINLDVYALAFQGAQSGLVAFERNNTSTIASSYNVYSAIAQTWAQSFDTTWNSGNKLDEVQAMGIHDGSFGFWAGITNFALLSTLTTAQCAGYILPIIASIQSSESAFTAQSIVPPLWGGSSTAYTTVAVSFNQPAVNATITISVGITNWMIVGEILFIGTNGANPAAGYYKITAIPSSTSVTLQNLGYVVNAIPGTIIVSGSGVGPAGIQGSTGPSVSGLVANEIVFGSSTGIIQQSTGLSWNDTSQVLSLGKPAGSGTTNLTPSTFAPSPTSGTYTIQPVALGSSAGTNINVTGGLSTVGSGGTITITGGFGGTESPGGAINIVGGISGAGITSAAAGGNIFVKGGNSQSTAALGGNVTIQAGNSPTSGDNGIIKLVDGTGATAFQVKNGVNLLNAPLLGDPSANNPLCFGVVNVTYPPSPASPNIILTSSQSNCQTIRISGTANPGTILNIVVPDVGGGYTKILDLTNLQGAATLFRIAILAGSLSQLTPSKITYINAPVIQDVYTVSYDGTTLTCNQSSATTQIATNVPTISGGQLAANVSYNIVSQTIKVGPSGTIAAFLTSSIIFTYANTQISAKFLLDGTLISSSIQLLNYTSYPSGFWNTLFNMNYPFTSLTPGSIHTITVQYNSTEPWAVYNPNLILLSP